MSDSRPMATPLRRMGRYDILAPLAEGGMAELFLARLAGVEGFTRLVVLKRILPHLARDAEFVRLFLDEARLAATLHHHNIVQVHDIDQDAGGYFFAMEYLHGDHVGHVLEAAADKRRDMPLEVALEIALGACAGLHYAHERTDDSGRPRGLVHRDVSPQNLFATYDGHVKLLDFGIAKAREGLSDRRTRTGTIRGKLPYMSPEQIRAEPIDRRSDVFSLAAVVWEMTTGKRLFGANPAQSDIDIAREIVDLEVRRPSTVKPGYPDQLEQIVMKGLARDPAHRYQTAEALQIDLEAMIRTRGMWVSSRDLIAFMRDVFADRLAAWQSAQRDGRSAAEMLAAVFSSPSTSTVVPFQLGPPSMPPPLSPQPMPSPPPTPSQSPSPSPSPSPAPRYALWAIGVVLVIAASVFGGWLAGRGARTSAVPSTATPAQPTITVPGQPPVRPLPRTVPSGEAPANLDTEDEHFLQADDYLISDQAYASGRIDDLEVAKMTAPSTGPNSPATFLTAESAVRSTNHYWRTRVAMPDDLVFGAIAFCPTANTYDNHSRKLDNKRESRMSPWSIARITDVADIERGKVQLGELTCTTNVVRVQL